MKTMLSRFNTDYFFSVPPETQIIWFWLGFFILVILATFIVYFTYRAKGIKAKPYRRYAKNFFWPNFTLGIAGLVLTFSRYEKLALLSWRFWVYVTILLVIFYNAWYFMIKRNQLEDELVAFHNNLRKSKWIKKPKIKSKK